MGSGVAVRKGVGVGRGAFAGGGVKGGAGTGVAVGVKTGTGAGVGVGTGVAAGAGLAVGVGAGRGVGEGPGSDVGTIAGLDIGTKGRVAVARGVSVRVGATVEVRVGVGPGEGDRVVDAPDWPQATSSKTVMVKREGQANSVRTFAIVRKRDLDFKGVVCRQEELRWTRKTGQVAKESPASKIRAAVKEERDVPQGRRKTVRWSPDSSRSGSRPCQTA